MTVALIQPKTLSWALKRSHAPLEDIAKSAHVKVADLESWQKGKKAPPTIRQAQHLAQVLHIPFGYLFLSEPPKDDLPLPDLRTIRNEELKFPSPELQDVIDDVLRKRDWYKEYLLQQGTEPVKFIGRFNVKNAVQKVAADISEVLGINESLRKKVSSWEEFLRELIDVAQANRILVLRSGIVGNNTHRPLSVEEFRGFAISDDVAPLIFLNGKDSKAAQIFTLAHEIVHLWLGASGISNLDIREEVLHQKEIELFCNSVAAEILVPEKSFLENWSKRVSIEDNLHKLVRKYRVSSLVVLRRVLDLQLISLKAYREACDVEEEKFKQHESRGKEESGGNFYSTFLMRNSGLLTSTIVAGALEGKVLYREASRLLGVHAETLHGIATNLGIK